jgi:hypothetical protein
MKRIALLVTTALMSLAMVFAITGCGGSDEATIRNGLTDELNDLKDPNSATWSEVAGEMPADVIFAWLDGYNFEIGEIAIEGDAATVKVTVTNKQLLPVVVSTQTRLQGEIDSSMTSEEIEKKANEILLDELQKAQPKTTDIEINCEKSGNTWSVSDVGISELTLALLGQ